MCKQNNVVLTILVKTRKCLTLWNDEYICIPSTKVFCVVRKSENRSAEFWLFEFLHFKSRVGAHVCNNSRYFSMMYVCYIYVICSFRNLNSIMWRWWWASGWRKWGGFGWWLASGICLTKSPNPNWVVCGNKKYVDKR